MKLPMKILIVGRGEAGKDEMANWLCKNAQAWFGGSTSRYLTLYVVERFLGIDHVHAENILQLPDTWLGKACDHAYKARRANRDYWKETGDLVRKQHGDDAIFVRESLKNGSIVVGVRDRAELIATKAAKLVDVIVWIERPDKPVDTTVTFTKEDCDEVILNDGTLEEFHEKIRDFCVRHGILLFT